MFAFESFMDIHVMTTNLIQEKRLDRHQFFARFTILYREYVFSLFIKWTSPTVYRQANAGGTH